MMLSTGSVLAQAGPGGGVGAGPGASAPGMGAGPGMKGGQGRGARWGTDYTPGWALLTPAERTTHQDRMRAMKTYDECKAYMVQHREEMTARAKASGGKPLQEPKRDACGGLKP